MLSQRLQLSVLPSSLPPPEGIPELPTLQLGMTWETIEEAKDFITDAIIDAHQSFDVQGLKPDY